MEIRDVVGNLRGAQLQLSLELQSIRSQVNMLERFTWNLLTDLRRAVESGQVVYTWELAPDEAYGSNESTVDSTVDTPERTDDGDPTLF